MGLQPCFTAADALDYQLWDGVVPGTHYNDYLITPPRVYSEELQAITTTYTGGTMWVERSGNKYSEYTLNHWAVMTQYAWPGWGLKRWRLDAQFGHRVSSTAWVGSVVMDQITYEPSGFIWWFGAHADAYQGGPTLVDASSLAPTTTHITNAQWRDAKGNVPGGATDFAIDRGNDRMMVRWNTNAVGEVGIYKYSTKQLLANIYTPNSTCGIIVTGDGFIYVVDVLDWLIEYDYNGVFQNAFRNPRRQTYLGGNGGVVYGWDPFFKRLLFAGVTPNAANGACTVRPQGFYPVAAQAALTPPIPRQVPRKNKRTTFFSHLCGEGAEALANRTAAVSGIVVSTPTSDLDGDIIFTATPPAAGIDPVTVSVDDVPLNLNQIVGAIDYSTTLLTVVLSAPVDGTVITSPASVSVTISGATGLIAVTFYISRNGGPAQQLAAPPRSAATTQSVSVSLSAGTWTFWAVARDERGVTGTSNQATATI